MDVSPALSDPHRSSRLLRSFILESDLFFHYEFLLLMQVSIRNCLKRSGVDSFGVWNIRLIQAI